MQEHGIKGFFTGLVPRDTQVREGHHAGARHQGFITGLVPRDTQGERGTSCRSTASRDSSPASYPGYSRLEPALGKLRSAIEFSNPSDESTVGNEF